MILSPTDLISSVTGYLSVPLIITTVLVAYLYVILKGGFVSDDLAGIASYDGKLQGREYGMISRWLRYHICGGNFPSDKKYPNGEPIPQGKIPARHHTLVVTVFTIACILNFFALKNIIGAKLALMAICLFIVHPVGVQAVAWCSGLGYPLSLFWIGAMLNIVQWAYPLNNTKLAIALPIFLVFQFLGIHAQFIPMMTCVILWFLGYKLFAVIGAIISAIMLFDIIKQTIKLRKDEFEKQKMGQSTFLHWRKFMVAMKTLLYYLGLVVAPRKMGLYHKWGFHYSKDLERDDHLFWLGLAGFIGLIGIFTLCPIEPIRLGILWFLAFSVIFWNWVTIQQFVTERYIFIPTLGFALIVSYITQNHFWIYSLIFGLYLCRTWVHLPTYDNELRFYQSNHWNFQDSEVALGNLGVTYINAGMEGTALDTWNVATQINGDYDVPWYNIFSTYRTKAVMAIQHGRYMEGIQNMQIALPYMEKVLSCKVCHFPDIWAKERNQLKFAIANPQLIFQEEMERLNKLAIEYSLMKLQAQTKERAQEVEQSIINNQKQIESLSLFMTSNGIPLNNNNGFMQKLYKKEM